MFRRFIYPVSFILLLSLVGSASAAVLYSDSFDRPDNNSLGTNDNALGGIVTAPWVEVETAATVHQISGNALLMAGANGNSYIGHKFTGAELVNSFTLEFDVVANSRETGDHWIAIEFAPAPESFTRSVDVNQNRVTFGLLIRPQANFVLWDNSANLGTNGGESIDNSSNPASIKLQIDSPDGYNDGDTATIQMWINDVPVENFGGASSLDFTWQDHTDGLYISIENHQGIRGEGIDNVVISSSFSPVQAFDPNPASESVDVPRDAVLNWTRGEYASTHDVYFGISFDDVNNATSTVDPASVYKGRQSESTYVPDRFDLGETYYWRIDEVNGPPDFTLFKGSVWQFTAEPVGYPIENIAVTASSENTDGEGPGNTINGSGLDDDDLHSSESTAMWLTNMMDPNTAWIQFEFDRSYKLYQMLVWNYNSTVEPAVGFGIKEAAIEYSVDGASFSVLGTTHEFAQGPGLPGYASNTPVDLSGVTARYVRITANSNWSPYGLNQFGLSEVRFLYIPVWPREPSPDSGATDVGVDTILSFRTGREAARHDVYLDTDEQAVIDGLATATSVTEPGYAPSLDLAATYYWRIDEVNDAESPTTWQGDIWSLSTQEYLVVDDFESYNDILSGQEGSRLVYEIWSDGFSDPSKGGSQIGYFTGTSLETDTVYDGSQSVPLLYDNTMAASSEVTVNVADLQAGQDWTKHGIKALTLRFFGDPNNSVNEQMYVKIDGTKVVYDGSAEDIRLPGWQMWYIDLASTGVNLGNVTTLSIGFERIGAFGGKGVVLLDGIRLYSYDRQLITPVDPGAVGLQAHYAFEGNANDSSGNARHGVAMSNPMFVPGKTGQAIGLNGIDQYVTITGYKGILADASDVQQPFTVAAWVKTIDDGDRTIASWGTNSNQLRVDFRLFEGRLRVEHGAGNVQGDTTLNDDEWHHVAVTVSQGATISYPEVQLWLDGMDNTRNTTTPQAFSIAADVDMAIGYRATAVARYFFGAIDEVRLYDRVLSPGEIAWLAARTELFDKPF